MTTGLVADLAKAEVCLCIIQLTGNGSYGFSGDGGLATSAQLAYPHHLAVDGSGNLYVADYYNYRIRKITPAGIISTVAGTSTCCSSTGKAVSVYIGQPGGIAVDAVGNLFIARPNNSLIAKVTPSGDILTIAGNSQWGFAGDGGFATSASVNWPAGLALDSAGDLYFADSDNNRIRKLSLNSPVKLQLVSGDGASGAINSDLSAALSVRVMGRVALGVPGVSVAFAITSGSGTVSAASTSSDATGLAGVGFKFGNAAGAVTVTATVAGLTPVVFNLTATPTASSSAPAIAPGGIVGAGGSVPAIRQISPNALVTIYGANFAPVGTAQLVGAGDMVNGRLPTKLAAVCVNVGGIPASITAVFPGQINIQIPRVPVNTDVDFQVLTNCGGATETPSAKLAASVQAATPEFLYWIGSATGKNPVIAVNAVTGAHVGAAGLIPGLTFTPAKPGDILTIYGISFGDTNPSFATGEAPSSIGATVLASSVTLGTVKLAAADTLYAGVSPGTAGLYQLNIRVPDGLPDGDYPIVLNVGTFATPAGGFLTIKN